MSTFPIAPIAPVGMVDGLTQVAAQPLPRAQAAGSFAQTLMMQVRSRLLEGYQEILRMQL